MMLKTIIVFKDNIKEFVKSKLTAENVFVACKFKDINKIEWETLSGVKSCTGIIIIPDDVSFIEFCIKTLGTKIENEPDTGIFDEGKLITKEGTKKRLYTPVAEPEVSDEEVNELFEEEETKGLTQQILPQNASREEEEDNPFELNQTKETIPEINIPSSKIAAATENFSMGTEGVIEEPDDYVEDNIESDSLTEVVGGSAIHVSEESLAKAERIPVDLSGDKKKRTATAKKSSAKATKPAKPTKPLDERMEDLILSYKGRIKKDISAAMVTNIIKISKNAISVEELAESIACVLDKKKVSELDRELAKKLAEELKIG